MTNFVQLIEIYENPGSVFSRRQVSENTTTSSIERTHLLRRVLINLEHVTVIKENSLLREKFIKDNSRFPEDLDERQKFTTIQFGSSRHGGSTAITVVGCLETLTGKLNGAS
jgi:hypothetical protein